MDIPEKVGLPVEVIARKMCFGKTLLRQDFRNPKTGKIDDFYLFDYKMGQAPAIVLPITEDKKVVAIKQYRHGANEIIWEIPGGNKKKPEESLDDVIRTELREETGYEASEVIQLQDKLWFEPACFTVPYVPYLALGCKKVAKQELDDTEQVEVFEIDLEEWINMILDGVVVDNKTIAMTMISLRRLGMRIMQIP